MLLHKMLIERLRGLHIDDLCELSVYGFDRTNCKVLNGETEWWDWMVKLDGAIEQWNWMVNGQFEWLNGQTEQLNGQDMNI